MVPEEQQTPILEDALDWLKWKGRVAWIILVQHSLSHVTSLIGLIIIALVIPFPREVIIATVTMQLIVFTCVPTLVSPFGDGLVKLMNKWNAE